MSAQPKKQFRWKGKIVSEKKYNHMLRLTEFGRKRRKTTVPVPNEQQDEGISKECRFINLGEMMKHMKCFSCNADLHLANITKEDTFGLGSLFHISCSACSSITRVPSSKKNDDSEGTPSFEINKQFILGCMYAGIDYKAINEILTALEITSLDEAQFNALKNSISPTVENNPEIHGESSSSLSNVASSLRTVKANASKKSSPRRMRSHTLRPTDEILM